MDELTIKFIIALILIFMGFIFCLLISFGGACLFFCGGSFASGLPFFKVGEPIKGIPLMILGASIYFSAFPLGAWILENDLRFLTPDNLPSISFVYLFGSSQITLTFFLVIFAQILSFWNNWHPRNGEQKIYYRTGKIKTLKNWKNNKLHGEVKHYCTDGRVFYRANFDSGLLTGEIYQTDCVSFDKDKTVSFYQPAGVLVFKKTFYGGNLLENFEKTEFTKKDSHYTSDGELMSETITEFENSKLHSNKFERIVSRSYDIKTKKILAEEVREYRNNQTIIKRRVFDVEKGTLVSDEIDKI